MLLVEAALLVDANLCVHGWAESKAWSGRAPSLGPPISRAGPETVVAPELQIGVHTGEGALRPSHAALDGTERRRGLHRVAGFPDFVVLVLRSSAQRLGPVFEKCFCYVAIGAF